MNGTLSWQEQRNFTNLGLEALGNHTLATEIVHQLGLIQAKQPNMSGENQIRQVYTKHVQSKPNMTGQDQTCQMKTKHVW